MKPEGVTCEICLRPDEPEWMLSIDIEHSAANVKRVATICRDCCRVIVASVKAAFELEQETAANDAKRNPA